MDDAGTVEQHVHTALRRRESRDGLGVEHVEDLCFDIRRGGGERLQRGGVDIRRDGARAGLRESERHGPADARARRGYDSRLSFKPSLHGFL
jgi:hypothetical protein